jgi:hypothetical protein
MNKTAQKISFICLALAILLCIVLFFTWQAGKHTEFNSGTWKNEQLVRGKDYIRKKMVHDLLKSNRLEGKSRAEINELLGPSTKTGKFIYECDNVYWLGPEGGFGVDSLWLCIKFDDRSDGSLKPKLLTD